MRNLELSRLRFDTIYKFIFVIVFFFPLLPGFFRDSQIHINILVFSVSFLLILVGYKNVKLFKYKWVFIYYILLQLFLISAVCLDVRFNLINLGSIFSFLRPMMLLIITIFCCNLILRSNLNSSNFLFIISIISVLYFIIEVFFYSQFSFFVFGLYKREYRPELLLSGVSFFGTTYYAGYAFFIAFLLSLINLHQKKSFKSYITSFSFVFLVFAAQSKTMVLVLFMSVYMYWFFTSRYHIVKFMLSLMPILVILIITSNMAYLSDLMANSGLVSLRSLNTLLNNTSNSGTLNIRYEQVHDAFELSYQRAGVLGAGLGRGERLESLLAVFFYRYGIAGVVLFHIAWLSMVIYSHSHMNRLRGCKNFIYPLICFIWALTLPITQMSGVMIEMSKSSFLTAILLAYLMNLKEVRRNV